MTTDHLIISQVAIEFPTPQGTFKALDRVDLRIDEGELISLIGHSGCGKSTLLNIVAGLLEATSGGVILDGREVRAPGPDRAVVFQNHSLLPWLSAYENVALAVRQVFRGRKTRAEMDEWIRHNLELVHMGHAMHKRPSEISGGMKQRVGIARALAMEPRVLLMDEPFGALDALTRAHMQDTLMEIHARLNNTVILITHDVDEAVLLSDRIVMMTNGPAATAGEILQIDLLRPRNRLELASDRRYNHYRAEVVRFLHERHAKPDVPITPSSTLTAPTDPSPPIADLAQWRERRATLTGKQIEKMRLTLGFVPLTDCAPLVIAKEKGFFRRQGLEVELSRESSWANVRDKLCIGMLDGAQMLAGVPLFVNGSDGARCTPLVTALSLDLNGNAVTVSTELYEAMRRTELPGLDTPLGSAMALRQVIVERRRGGSRPLTFASVFPVSSHHYLLRYWMASAGIDPDRDVRLTVVPPPQMVNYLRAGVIAGYCVGEPWNTHAVSAGLGRTLITSYDIWNNHPEKVFAVTRHWAEAHPNAHQALLVALLEAAAWLDRSENRVEACALLSPGRYVNAPVDVLRMSMAGTFQFAADEPPASRPDFNVFHRYGAGFPWRSHALWTLSQMVRWGQLPAGTDLRAIARATYWPETYRAAAAAVGLPYPTIDEKVEGLHPGGWTLEEASAPIAMGADRFMDGRCFGPDDVAGYLADFDPPGAGPVATASLA